jgi:hypothetical protein
MEHFERLDRIERSIYQLPRHTVHRKDCLKMMAHCEQLAKEISMETVECRRMRKETVKYRQLMTEFEQSCTNLEHHVLLAKLQQKY